jgi:acyl carrier protein
MTHIEETIRNYIQTSFLVDGQLTLASNGDSADGLGTSDDLLAILDSLQILRMLLDLEAEYAIKVENSELTPDNLGTISRLARFIADKRQAAACQGPTT